MLRRFSYYILCLWLFVWIFCVVPLQAQNTRPSNPSFVTIASISFKGNTSTKEKIIARELSIHVGDTVRIANLEDELNYNVRRILNLQLFSTAHYQICWVSPSAIEVQFTVTEIFYWIARPIFELADRNFNVWWKDQDHDISRTNLGAELTRMNFRGRNEDIVTTLQLGYNKLFDFYYKVPYLDSKLKHGMGIEFSYATGKEINYQTNKNKQVFYHHPTYPYRKFQAKLHYYYRRMYAAVHEIQLSYNNFWINDDLFQQNSNFLGGKKKINYLDLSYIYAYNHTDFRVYPTSGLESKWIISKKGLGIDRDVNRFEISNQTSVYLPIRKRFSGAFIFRGKLATPQRQPFIFNRALGYKNEYVRGYEYYVIDGSHYALLRGNIRYKIIDRVLHQQLISFMKFIPVRVFAKIYDDIGYVYNKYPGNSYLHNTLLNGYGAGIDLVISYYLKFRFEYSFNHLGQKGLFLHGAKE